MKHEHIDIKTFNDLIDFIKLNIKFFKKVLIASLLLTSFYSIFTEV